MIDLIEDIAVLTSVHENTLKKFVPSIRYSIGHAVMESLATKQEITKIDLGFGELHIKVAHDGIHYRFVPDKELEKLITNTAVTKTSPILNKVETNLQQKIDHTYKELL